MDVLLIGGYPPPYGGVSVHIQRLAALCVRRGIRCRVIDPYGVSKVDPNALVPVTVLSGGRFRMAIQLVSAMRRLPSDIIHVHASTLGNFVWAAPLILMAASGRQSVVTLHSGALISSVRQHPVFMRWWVRYLLSRFDALVAINDEQKDFLCNELGLTRNLIITSPAYVRVPADYAQPCEDFDRFVADGLTLRRQPLPMIVMAGFAMEHYGFHLGVEALAHLRDTEGLECRLVIVLYARTDPLYKARLFDLLQDFPDRLILQDMPPQQFVYVLRESTLLIRPTLVDSFGVSISEALDLGTPVIASDVCLRPAGTTLFRAGDSQALADKIRQVLSNLPKVRSQIQNLVIEDYGGRVVDLYALLSSGKVG